MGNGIGTGILTQNIINKAYGRNKSSTFKGQSLFWGFVPLSVSGSYFYQLYIFNNSLLTIFKLYDTYFSNIFPFYANSNHNVNGTSFNHSFIM